MTLSIDIKHNSIECHYPECRDYLNVMLNAIMLNVIILRVIRLNIDMLSVVAPISLSYSNIRLSTKECHENICSLQWPMTIDIYVMQFAQSKLVLKNRLQQDKC